MRAPTKALMTLTPTAAEKLASLLKDKGYIQGGVRIMLKTKGCSGLSYALEFAQEKGPYDEVVEDQGVRLFIDPKAVMFLVGAEMDYQTDRLQSGFTFMNPNEKARCGCGDSFHA